MSSDRYPERASVAETSLRRLESLNGEVAFLGCYSIVNIFSLHIEGKDARARGSAMYRAMMGQSDAVKVAMLKHSQYQCPVNHRTTSVPSTRHASARRVPPRSGAHESRRLQWRDARARPAPPCVLPPLRLGASRCARTFV